MAEKVRERSRSTAIEMKKKQKENEKIFPHANMGNRSKDIVCECVLFIWEN